MTISSKSSNLTPDREAVFHQIRLFSGLSDKRAKFIRKRKGGMV